MSIKALYKLVRSKEMKKTMTMSLLAMKRSKNDWRRVKACEIRSLTASRIHKDSCYVAILVVLSLAQKYTINLISERLESNLISGGPIPISRTSTLQIKPSSSCQRIELSFSTIYRANAKSSALAENYTT